MDFKSPDHDNNSDGNDTSSTDVPSALSPRQWFQSKSTNKERLNFPEFVRAMGYWREQDAHDAFMNILSLEIFPRKVWEAAINDYEVWRLNDGREFWASRAISSQMSMSAKRTAVSIITRGESIIKLLDDSRQDSGIEDLTGSYKVGQKHPRDPSGYEGARLPKTQRSRYEEDEVEDDVRNDGDSANTDDHNVAEQGTGSTSFDQDPLFSTTSSEAIRSSKQTTTSSLELFDLPPETDALVCPPITGDHLTDTPPVTITVTGGLTDTESDPCGQLAAGTSISQNQGQSRISSGCGLTMEDLNPPEYSSGTTSRSNPPGAEISKPSEILLDPQLLSSDPNDQSFVSDQELQSLLYESTNKVFSWNFLLKTPSDGENVCIGKARHRVGHDRTQALGGKRKRS